MHQRGQTKRRLAVVAEAEERRPVRNQAAVNGHPVDRRAHAKLAHAEKDIAALADRDGSSRSSLKIVLVEVVRSAAPPINSGTALAMASMTSPPALRVAIGLASAAKTGRLFSQPAGQLAGLRALELGRQIRDTPSCSARRDRSTPARISFPCPRPGANSAWLLPGHRSSYPPASPASSWFPWSLPGPGPRRALCWCRPWGCHSQ